MFNVTPASPLFMASPTPFTAGFASAPIAAPSVAISAPTTSAVSGFNTSLLNDSLNLLTTGLAAFTQFQTSRFQAKTAEFEANMLRVRAAQENLKAREEVMALRKKVQKDIGRARALFSARGIRLGEGSAQAAIERSISEESEAIETLTLGGERRASQLNFQADIKRAEGSVAKSLGLLGIGQSLSQSLLAFNPPTRS